MYYSFANTKVTTNECVHLLLQKKNKSSLRAGPTDLGEGVRWHTKYIQLECKNAHHSQCNAANFHPNWLCYLKVSKSRKQFLEFFQKMNERLEKTILRVLRIFFYRVSFFLEELRIPFFFEIY